MNWVAYTAGLWALIFALFHVVWAAGWYIGLDAEKSEKAFAVPWMLAYDIVIAAMCAIAVPIALAFVRPWGKRLPRKLFRGVTWTGTMLLLVRAAASMVQAAVLVFRGKFFDGEPRHLAWELWFYLGALLWGVSVWLFTLRETPKIGAENH